MLTVFDPALPASLWECTGVKAFFHQSDTASVGSTAPPILSAVPAGGVVHFACHARAESGTPLRNAIILPAASDHRRRHPRLRHALTRRRPVVVLSACESSMAGPYVIDETISLPAAFLAAGFGGVLSTLWEVEDVSTTLLMLQFYWQWRHDQRVPSLALAHASTGSATRPTWRNAASSKIRSSPGAFSIPSVAGTLAQQIRERSTGLTVNSYSEPYYWAGFSFSGR